MRFDLTDEQEQVRQTARRFLENEAPLTEIRKLFETPAGFSRDLWRRASQLGWTAMGASERAGGFSASGNPGQDMAIIAEELGRLIGAGPFLPSVLCIEALSQGDDSERRDDLIAQILAGDAIAAWAFGEANSAWTPESFKTRVRETSGEVVLDGAKAYVESGAEADVLVVTARSDQGLVQVLVPADVAGLTVISGRSVDFVRRFAEVRFDAVRLPRSDVITRGPAAEAQVERQYQLALLLQCAETNGAVERAFEFTVDYMQQRYAFGRAIASFQALKHRLADMLVRNQSCMATTDAGLEAFDARSPDAGRLARVAKCYVAAKSTAIVSDLVQMSGGIGVTWDHDLHLYERRIAVNRAVLATPEALRLEVHRLISA